MTREDDVRPKGQHGARRQRGGEADERRFHAIEMDRLADGLEDREIDQFAQALGNEGRVWLGTNGAHEGTATGLARD
jgi:hypothetical protein